MPFSYRDLFCGGKTFCCCLPVRIGVIIMSLLGIIFGAVLSIVLWFEVASNAGMGSGERAWFIVAGLVESFLFAASILGFVGAIVRKQVFVQIYAYFIYVHFLLNIAVAGYLLYLVTHFSKNATVKACQDTIKNEQAKDQCTSLLKVARGVYFVVAAGVLLVELYGALIVTRYVNQVKGEKRSARSSRLENEEAFSLVSKGKGRYSYLPGDSHDRTMSSSAFPAYSGGEFDPYEEIREERGSVYRGSKASETSYGGGAWTHEEISREERARAKREEVEEETRRYSSQRSDLHSSDEALPPFPAQTGAVDALPRYALSDPPTLR